MKPTCLKLFPRNEVGQGRRPWTFQTRNLLQRRLLQRRHLPRRLLLHHQRRHRLTNVEEDLLNNSLRRLMKTGLLFNQVEDEEHHLLLHAPSLLPQPLRLDVAGHQEPLNQLLRTRILVGLCSGRICISPLPCLRYTPYIQQVQNIKITNPCKSVLYKQYNYTL